MEQPYFFFCSCDPLRETYGCHCLRMLLCAGIKLILRLHCSCGLGGKPEKLSLPRQTPLNMGCMHQRNRQGIEPRIRRKMCGGNAGKEANVRQSLATTCTDPLPEG